ncbi:MAG: DAK2 domain-containing protein [Actinomycetaceae bacterium]|nr:DAK2 domain-containing protein [Actinomycetaceae bacterium]
MAGAAAEAGAARGRDASKDMVAHLGRSRPLGEKSLGTPDPGAVSLTKVIDVVARHFREK